MIGMDVDPLTGLDLTTASPVQRRITQELWEVYISSNITCYPLGVTNDLEPCITDDLSDGKLITSAMVAGTSLNLSNFVEHYYRLLNVASAASKINMR